MLLYIYDELNLQSSIPLDQDFIYSLVNHFSLDRSIWIKVDRINLSGLKLIEVDPDGGKWTELD